MSIDNHLVKIYKIEERMIKPKTRQKLRDWSAAIKKVEGDILDQEAPFWIEAALSILDEDKQIAR